MIKIIYHGKKREISSMSIEELGDYLFIRKSSHPGWIEVLHEFLRKKMS